MFGLEAEMIPVIEANLNGVLGNPKSLAQANELPVNNRVVDVAAAVVDAVEMESVYQLLRALPKLSLQQVDVLSLFGERDPLSVQYLGRRTFYDAPTIHRLYLDHFMNHGLVAKCSRYSYASTGWRQALPACVIAIEAKLSRWQEVLQQAIDNQVFADISYAALDVDQFRASRSCLDEFRRAGVGVLGVKDCGAVEVMIEPRSVSQGRDRSFQAIRVLRDLQSNSRKAKWRLVH